jgi:hypothetical protein
MRVPYSTWTRIIKQSQHIGTFDFCGLEVAKIAVCLALQHVGLWQGEEVDWS